MIEEWKVIKDYPDYQVSNLGRVKSFKKCRGINERILKENIDKRKYLCVLLCKNGFNKRLKVHRLVLISFKPIDNSQNYQCNHIDGNKQNNHVDNLEWCTGSENILHAYRMGLRYNKGEKHSQNILMEKQVKEIRILLKEGLLKQVRIAEMYGVSDNTISMIKLN